MDRVPRIFSERVAALWKCCDRLYCGGSHIQRRIPDCEWTRISRKRRIEFKIGSVDGKWMYGFRDPEDPTGASHFLAMAELKKFPGFKNVVICEINVFEKRMNPAMVSQMRPLDVDMEVLMKFVFFRSNEPHLDVEYISPGSLASPEGLTLLNWLQKMQFSHVNFAYYKAKYNRILKRQYSRRKAPRIEIIKIESGRAFLEAEFSALRMKNCNISEKFSPNLLDAIIARFLEDPGQFGEDYEVSCFFKLKKAKEILREMREKGVSFVNTRTRKLKVTNRS